jgi:hypothetical protein
MSFITLRQYFEDRMAAVDSELREWEDAFSIENIPSTILDKSWHIEFGPFSYTGSAHTCLAFDSSASLKVCLKGYRNPKEAVDTALILADAILSEVTDPTKRLNQPKIKNVLPRFVDVRQLGTSNDNVAVLEIQFNCNVMI